MILNKDDFKKIRQNIDLIASFIVAKENTSAYLGDADLIRGILGKEIDRRVVHEIFNQVERHLSDGIMLIPFDIEDVVCDSPIYKTLLEMKDPTISHRTSRTISDVDFVAFMDEILNTAQFNSSTEIFNLYTEKFNINTEANKSTSRKTFNRYINKYYSSSPKNLKFTLQKSESNRIGYFFLPNPNHSPQDY